MAGWGKLMVELEAEIDLEGRSQWGVVLTTDEGSTNDDESYAD